MDAKLVVVSGDAKPAEFKLKLPAILGRGRDASLTVPHPLVSRQHCEIFEKGGFLVVRDLGSLNGTFIDDERISEAVLHDGKLLTVGTVTFRAVYCADPNLSAPVAPAPPASVGTPSPREDRAAADRATPPLEDERPAASLDSREEESEDEQFAAFLESVDVEGEVEGEDDGREATGGGTEPTIQSHEPRIVHDLGHDEEVEEPEVVEEVAEPVDGGSDDLEEVEELAMPISEEPAPEVPRGTAAGPESPAHAEKDTPSTSQAAPSDDEDDELQAFLRDLGK